MKTKRSYLYLIIGVCCIFLLAKYGFCEEATSQPSEPVVNIEAPAILPEVSVQVNNETAPPTIGPEVKVETPAVNVEPAKAEEAPKTAEAAKPTAEELREIKWVWGEVASVDATNNKIIIKYLNYDTDVEETLTVLVDPATRFENAEGISAVKAGDNVGVDYMLNANGEAIAKSIALEKAESMPEASAEGKAETATPAPQEAAPEMNAVEAPTQK